MLETGKRKVQQEFRSRINSIMYSGKKEGMSEEEKAAKKIEEIPGTLIEAIYNMEADDFIRDVLGEHAYNKYIQAKKEEWFRYRMQVTDWEVNEYLNNV